MALARPTPAAAGTASDFVSRLCRIGEAPHQVMVDRFLHCIRLVKSRTLAQHVIEEGYVRIDGKRVEKPSEEVHIGNVIALPLNEKVRVLRVLSLPARRGPAPEAQACYKELGIDDASSET